MKTTLSIRAAYRAFEKGKVIIFPDCRCAVRLKSFHGVDAIEAHIDRSLSSYPAHWPEWVKWQLGEGPGPKSW